MNAEKCLIFHKHKNRRMHTTNNVPQSRCRAFLIYGELSETGRWSERRWRHAEGLHFSLFSPHKRDCERAPRQTTDTHLHTYRSKTQTDAGTRARATPSVRTCLLPLLWPHTRFPAQPPPPPHFISQPTIIPLKHNTCGQILRVWPDPAENTG